jgi:hypothetical protein
MSLATAWLLCDALLGKIQQIRYFDSAGDISRKFFVKNVVLK